ncbi:MAG: plasmid pRiA4b ORF-3 family protein, partial [Pseudomonadota bacterium]
GVDHPRCVAGQWACPPEDCGGPGGYQRLLAVLDNPQDPDYSLMCECWGNQIDPAELDLDAINRRLAS